MANIPSNGLRSPKKIRMSSSKYNKSNVSLQSKKESKNSMDKKFKRKMKRTDVLPSENEI